VDHPLVTATLIAELISRFEATHAPIVVPVHNGRRGHPVIFSAAVYDELLSAPADKGARAVVWAHAGKVVEVPTEEEGCVLNLNDPETLQRAAGRTSES